MTAEDIQFHEEEDVGGFLGVHIDRKSDGTIHLTQQEREERIVAALHLNNPSITPVEIHSTGYLAIR